MINLTGIIIAIKFFVSLFIIFIIFLIVISCLFGAIVYREDIKQNKKIKKISKSKNVIQKVKSSVAKGCKYCKTKSNTVTLSNGKKYKICSKCGNRYELPTLPSKDRINRILKKINHE